MLRQLVRYGVETLIEDLISKAEELARLRNCIAKIKLHPISQINPEKYKALESIFEEKKKTFDGWKNIADYWYDTNQIFKKYNID